MVKCKKEDKEERRITKQISEIRNNEGKIVQRSLYNDCQKWRSIKNKIKTEVGSEEGE